MSSADAHGRLPPGLPLLASLQTGLLWRWPLAFLDAMRARYGPRFTVRALGRPPLVFLADPDEAKAVFAALPWRLRPGEGGAAILPIVGRESFMLADEREHQRGRALLASTFTEEATARHATMVREIAEREVASWPRDVPIALHDRLRALTLKVILTTLFGSDLEVAPDLHARVLSMLSVTAGTALTLPRTNRLPGSGGAWRRFMRERALVDDRLHRLIAARSRGAATGGDVLGLLLVARDEHGEPLSSRYVRDSLMSLILAGHETTAAELAWTLLLVGHDRVVRGHLVDELRTGRPEYLTATVQEALRHRPVFLFAIPRAVAAPTMIGEREYRPPVHLLVCLYLIQHDPALFPEPQMFRPERFLGRQPGPNWLPWGGGRKRCLGRRLALLELETVLAAVLSKVDLQPVSTTLERAGWRSVIVTPRAGARVILRDRRR